MSELSQSWQRAVPDQADAVHPATVMHAAARSLYSARNGSVATTDRNGLQVLNVAYMVVGGLCTFIGATGYYMYGTAARDLVTFNLPAVRMQLSQHMEVLRTCRAQQCALLSEAMSVRLQLSM